MRKRSIMTLVSALWLMPSLSAHAGEELDLVQYMSSLQYFAHKAGLAIEHRNLSLTAFYAHELDEILEKLADIDVYDDKPIKRLAESLIFPAFERLDGALEGGQWPQVTTAFDNLVKACNACHEATDHAYIRIERASGNPYMQSFEPVP